MPKNASCDQTADKQAGQQHDHTGEYRDQRIPEYMRIHHDPLRQSFGPRCADIIAIDLLEKYRTIPSRAEPEPGQHTDGYRQHSEFKCMQPAVETRDWDQSEHFADYELTADDIEQTRYRHHRDHTR